MSVEIVGFNLERDYNYVISTFEDMYASNPNFIKSRKSLEIFEEEIKSFNKSSRTYLTLLVEGKVKGYLFCVFRDDFSSGLTVWTIQKLYIDKEYRRRNYATKLMEKAKEIAKINHASAIELHSFEANKEFYEKLGFKIVGYSMEMKL